MSYLSNFVMRKFVLWAEEDIEKGGKAARSFDEQNYQHGATTIEESLKVYFPDLRMPPIIAIPAALGFVYADMRIGAKDLPKPGDPPATPASSSTPAPARVDQSRPESVSAVSPPAPPSSSTPAPSSQTRSLNGVPELPPDFNPEHSRFAALRNR